MVLADPNTGIADIVIFYDRVYEEITTPGIGGSDESYSDSINGYNVHIALTDTAAALHVISNRAVSVLRNAGYDNVWSSLTSVSGNDDYAVATGYVSAENSNGDRIMFNVSYSNYWTVKVDGTTVDVVLDGGDSDVLDGTQALTGKGTGYVMANTYAQYSDEPDVDSVTTSVTIETGYATINNRSGISTGIAGGTLSISGLEGASSPYYFDVDEGLTVTYTTGASNTAAGDPMNLTLAVTTAGVVVNTPTQQMTEALYEVTGSTLTWTLDTSNITANITTNPDITVTAAAAPQSREITYNAVDCSTANTTGGDLAITLTGVETQEDGKDVVVTVTLDGTSAAGDTFYIKAIEDDGTPLTVTKVAGPALDGISVANGDELTVDANTTFNNDTVQFQFTVNGDDVTVSADLSDI